MANVMYSHMCHWKNIPYKSINNFREFYYEDLTNTAYFSDWDRILRYQKALGFDGIEMAPWDLPKLLPIFGSASEFAAFADDHGVKVSGMFHGATDSHLESSLQRNLEATTYAVETVVAFGGKHLNTCPNSNYYGRGPLTREEVQTCANTLTEMGKIATDSGVLLGLHNEFFAAINKENHREFIDLCDARYVHYCVDTAQISIIGEDLLEFYEDYHDRIVTFHLKDTASPRTSDEIRYSQDPEITEDGHRWFWEPGEGVLDFKGLYELLKKRGFKGWITIETDETPDLLASMALSKYFLDRELSPIYA